MIKKILSVILVIVFALSFISKTKAMDKVRAETRVDEAVAKFGVTGKDVIVAIMDRGIEFENKDFRNSDGSTRIKFIFDLTDDSGANALDNIYKMGTIYTEEQINQALSQGTRLATRDAVGHGTATAGVSSGNGQNNPKYRGIAPESSLIIVKITSDGAPAIGDEPSEAPFFKPERIPIGIDGKFHKTLKVVNSLPGKRQKKAKEGKRLDKIEPKEKMK